MITTSTSQTIQADAVIDLHMHTTNSDGRWTASKLIEYLIAEKFDLVAITDHDRVDKLGDVVQIAEQHHFSIIPGVEVSTTWQGHYIHLLCYGVPWKDRSSPFIAMMTQFQRENSYTINTQLRKRDYAIPNIQNEYLQTETPIDNAQLLCQYGYALNWHDAMRLIAEAQLETRTLGLAEVVDAAHHSDVICLIAHPGRNRNGATVFDTTLLDQLRKQIPFDGLEVYHPSHTPECTELYLKYVQRHQLLLSTGSDSHCTPISMPIKYPASTSRQLLERLGIILRD